MLLKSISYSEDRGKDQEWILEELTLGTRNLLVGKNATGKTRTLNLISGLAKLISGKLPPVALRTGNSKAIFTEKGKTFEYALQIEDKQVVFESFTVEGKAQLERGEGGEGRIFAEKVGSGTMIEFQTPQAEVAAFVRRDSKQHSFLEPLHQWASSVRHYHFGTALGRDNLAVEVKKGGIVPDGRDPEQVVGLFLRAKKDFPGMFENALLRDMEKVDYPLDSINVGPPVSIRYEPILSNELVGLRVKERGLKATTDQPIMSQGMFRVLSLLILTNYLECTQLPGSVIIDDIGEGLDFDRSCLLIDLLREKAEKSKFQLIASTNDKFVMNRVPLEEWSFLQRRGSHVKVLNYENSRELFEEFRFTGLSNFSFLEMDYPNAQQEQETFAP